MKGKFRRTYFRPWPAFVVFLIVGHISMHVMGKTRTCVSRDAHLCTEERGQVRAEWQWSVELPDVRSAETDGHPRAFLWIPSDCEKVRAVVMAVHNMTEETLFDSPLFRREMGKADVAVVWITPGLDMAWDVNSGCQTAFERMMDELAEVSGYEELKHAPVVPLGHSAMATFPWNFAAWNPRRTLAVISFHGDAPRTNLTGYGRENLEWGRTRNIDGIPGLMIEGEYEWWEARVNPALAFRMMYPGSCISFLCDAGRGHFDIADRTILYISRFIQKAVEYRLPDVTDTGLPTEMKVLSPEDGWLAARWRADEAKRPKAAPFRKFKGDRHDAFWYFDEEMAELTEEIYRRERGKRMQYVSCMQDGKLIPYDSRMHVKCSLPFRPDADGLTFHVRAVYTDSTRAALADRHAEGAPVITRVSGPARKVNDTTFMVSFYRSGMDNKRRMCEITLLASSDGDGHYKSTVQEIGMKIPFRHTEGKRQHILFPGVEDVKEGTPAVRLNAVSDCGLPIHYYIKEGPAVVSGDTLSFTPIPPRSRFPMKVTVVAWQYGIAGSIQTAEPVERSFYIVR